MASSSILNNIVEIKHVVHLDSTSNKLRIPYTGPGIYYVVANPLVTGQTAQELGMNDAIKECAFMIMESYGMKYIKAGPAFLYNSTGKIVYSTTSLSFDDNEQTIFLKINGKNGPYGNFLGNHDYYVLMAKES